MTIFAVTTGLTACSHSDSGDCEQTGIKRSDYELPFTVPDGLMPDNQFAGEKASLRVHRVSPEYTGSGCKPKSAIVLVHGKTIPGSVAFDLQHTTPESGPLSEQEALAHSGIDTFAPDLLGYGLSTRFENGLDDPANASLPTDKTRNPIIFPLNQQGRFEGDGLSPPADGLGVNPLNRTLKPHSSSTYFANSDVWARDIRQMIDDAIAKSGSSKVALLGLSAGAPRIGRVLHLLGPDADTKISHVIFQSALFDTLFPGPRHFDFPTEEKDLPPAERSTSFPLVVSAPAGWDQISPDRDRICTDRVPSGAPEALKAQQRALDPLAATWGGANSNDPTGLVREPTYTNSGLNKAVAGAISVPTLVLHGLDDSYAPTVNGTNLYDALTVSKKVLVEIDCASHAMHYETAADWDGPHRAVADAITEWLSTTTYNGQPSGHFTIDRFGTVTKK